MNALIEYGQDTQIVTKQTKFGHTVRLMTAKEFKEMHGLKGQEGKRMYNEYLRERGKANTAGLAAALTSGDLFVKGYTDRKNSLTVQFTKASSIKDPAPDVGKVKEMIGGMTEAEKAEILGILNQVGN